MNEFRFELALASHLEATTDAIVARQLGGAVANPGNRIVDLVVVEPGPEFDERAKISSRTIPPRAIEADVGPGQPVPRRNVLGGGEYARGTIEAAVNAGYFRVERRGGQEYVRATTRYPDQWFDRLVAVENKPDLGSPGELQRQLTHDVALGLFDEIVLATESYVTRAHLNRLPPSVGVWEFDPETGDRTIRRKSDTLEVGRPGVEPTERRSLRTDIAIIDADEKRRQRRRIAERAYGKGWRPDPSTYPSCEHAETTPDCRPYCCEYEKVVDPASQCGRACPKYAPGAAPAVNVSAVRADRTPWIADPPGVRRRQSGLDRFG